MKHRILGVAAAVALGLGAAVVPALTASAHVPAITVTCDGIVLHATAYDADKANTWTVSIDGQVQSGTFGATLDKTIPVPQEGKTSTIGAQITDADQTPEYSKAFAGPVGPCGTAPLPSVDLVPPTSTDATCDAPATYTLFAQPEGVKYTLQDQADPNSRPAPGTFTLADGQTITVEAHTIYGYQPKSAQWTFTGHAALGSQSTDASAACYQAPPVVTPPTDTTPTTPVVPTAQLSTVPVLAETGVDVTAGAIAASLLLLAGAGAIVGRSAYRRRHASN